MLKKLLKAFVLMGIVLAVASMAAAHAQTTVRYLHTDALGTVVAKTDANGNVVERTTFEPYGAVVGGAVADGPGYTGHVSDAATGLSYMQQRYYDPMLGRMLSRDPITAQGTGDMRMFNGYVYAFNNPYKYADPDGRQSKAVGKEIGRWARALWDNDGDFDKAKAQVDRQHATDLKVAETIVDFTAVGLVKDAVQVSVKVANGEDALGQGTGSVTGEVAGQVTERILDGKIGKGAAQAVGAVVGKAVGDTVEATVDRSRASNLPGVSAVGNSDPVNPSEPINLRDKQ